MKRRGFWILLVLAAIGLAAWFYRSELSSEVRAWRYRRSVAEAREALQTGNLEEVARLAGAALRLSSRSLPELRELFDLTAEVRSSDASLIGTAVFNHSDATIEDRIKALEFFSTGSDPLYIDGLLGELKAEERDDPRVIVIRLRRLVESGNRLEALLLVDSLPAATKKWPKLQLLKGRLLATEQGNPLAWQSCRRLLTQLMMEEEGAGALGAFRVLFLLPEKELRKVVEPDLSEWIEEQEGAEVEDFLLAARWRIQKNPRERDDIVKDVLKQSEQAPEAVARWLLRHGEEDLLLEGDLDLNSGDTFAFYLGRLQFHLNASHWEEARELLKAPHRSISKSFLLGLRAGVAGHLGDQVARVANLQEALEEARRSEDYREFQVLYQVGERLEDDDMKRKSSEGLVRLPARFLPTGVELGFLDQQFGDDPTFLASLYEKLTAAKPDDALMAYRKAVLDFVVEGRRDESLAALDDLLADYPSASQIRCARALVMADESAPDALAWLQGGEDQNLALEGAFEHAVQSYLLRRSGREEEARRLEQQISWSSLPVYLRNFFQNGRS